MSSSNNPTEDNTTLTHSGGISAAQTSSGPGAQGSSRPDALLPPSGLHTSFVGMSYHNRYSSTGRSAPVSSTNSVTSSRETSPTRPLRSINSAAASRSVSRSRKNSQELSPNRTPIPSPVALRRNLSNVNKPQFPPPSVEPSADLQRPIKSNNMPSKIHGDSSPQWPISPRLKSPPPPVLSSRNNLPLTSKRLDHETTVANMSSKRNPTLSEVAQCANTPEEEADDKYNRQNARVALNRGSSGAGSILETVQEAGALLEPPVPGNREENVEESAPFVAKTGVESGSDSGGNRGKPRISPANARPGDIISKRSFSSLSSTRGKLGDTPARNMIIEAETVSSIPQVSLGGGAGERSAAVRTDTSGSVRLKASDETIRPKKEKKKPVRRPTALPAGTVSSKADIFEAKVASAVDEADSSDSAETFIYESNPPDSRPAHPLRYHSRTPSSTSMASQADQYGVRPRLGLRDHTVTGKRSMKFTNTGYGALDGDGDQSSGRGSGRPNGHIHTTRHSHIGRHGRSGHPSVLDQSPFLVSQSQKPSRHSFINGSKQSRGSHSYRMTGNPKKNGDTYGYDFDGEGADDERTPLVGSVRVTRTRHARRPNSASLRQMEYMEQRQRSWLSRHGLCILLLIFLFLLAGGATTAVVGLMKPLTGVHVKKIRNVLASEQQIMFGLEVQAINSNLMTLTVNNMDVNIFAKSRYLGSESHLHGSASHPHMVVPRTKDSRTRARLTSAVKQNAASISDTTHATGGIDRGTDPIFADPPEDPVGDPQTMLLGRIFHFDSPLTFESSPWRHDPSSSIGEVRLAKPGNKTEEGGTARWERVLQNPFELIVRGVVKYQLPLTSRMRSASINSQITVVPNDDSGGGDNGDDNNDGADKKPPTTPGHHNNDTSAETYQS
ncbi:conserved hypothetical protein [Histoplasma capsulatum G186AR]|uniref:Phospholipid metabolism enzyme regulator n=2 Tax=Ajellomyces capsulatus TaxID=5037 RepID=C0NM88_AJECG|nr:uncharacterized protein HCBG_04618 [Histoplasma capsulatum G186AR]EEH07739.1 conserved hypothetical protein [Histoplasma capsulatum G186AR]KAG5304120.1 phospholipid metabolism enzyme regulator [Histoplasma capsulatum]QSS69718.1 phospholipid metabolism enzyme regulator [Histoplasma capsulatum G186AR]